MTVVKRLIATHGDPAPEAVRCSRPGCHRRAQAGAYKERLCMGCRYPERYARDNLAKAAYRVRAAERRAAEQAKAPPPVAASDRAITARRVRADVIWCGPGDAVRHAVTRLPAGTPVVVVARPLAQDAADDEPNFRGVVVELACGGRCVIDPEFLTSAKEPA